MGLHSPQTYQLTEIHLTYLFYGLNRLPERKH